ncbi:hypothetical protein U9M48_037401 [Paspalum notatum var. saurae]|uniref:Serine carboxypeptidase n=1 Tax=Paspalum notatum var. saurae TaxID=547442 RepID=A0AAQ3X9Y9_PASNO
MASVKLQLIPARLVVCCGLAVAAAVVLALPLSSTAAAPTVVTHLPGFDGPLPFYLETGYVDVEEESGTELFYYFVESERSPRTDPVLLWLTGGPRCSAFCGFAFEIGPVKFVLEPYDGTLPRLVYSPDSWTRVSSILFLDSPVGSGFSYARDPKGYDVGDASSSRQVVTFLTKVWNTATQQPCFIGLIVTHGLFQILSTLLETPTPERWFLLSHNTSQKGYLVGNPVTGDDVDQNSQIPYAHSHGIISDQQYEAAVANCEGDYVSSKNKLCADVLQTIKDLMAQVNNQDILQPICSHDSPKPKPKPGQDASARKSLLAEEHTRLIDPPEEPSSHCFEYRYYLSYFWANDNATRAALGIKEGTVTEWVRCKRTSFPYTYDVPSSIKYHFNLTTRGYRALVYRFTIKYANNLTFATVKGGRHEAAGNRPKECSAMAKRWLNNKPL